MKMFLKFVMVGVIVVGLLQLVRPSIPARPAEAEIKVPPAVHEILDRDCYSCHSDERRLEWFDQIVPGYWLVRDDILTARKHLNFSTIGAQPAGVQKAALYESVNMIKLGLMPLPRFLALHPGAKVTAQDLETLKNYLAPWAEEAHNTGAGAAPASAETAQRISLASVEPEFNGFPFDPDFENWKPISFTDRGDNNTFRLILANDIALKAAQSGKIKPWPDGARFAKIAWQQELGSDGLIHPGNFGQVELMLKGAARYKDTEGWGWGRWRGLDLKPYGKDVEFVSECTSCHLPMRGDDYVYTLPITAASVSGNQIVNNTAAALPANVPYRPLDWNAITMYSDRRNHTMATLYGDKTAIESVNARSASGPYASGAVLALVTWGQRDDPHWFGARIPDVLQSVEFVQVGADGSHYLRFAGPGLERAAIAQDAETSRTRFILGLAPARLP